MKASTSELTASSSPLSSLLSQLTHLAKPSIKIFAKSISPFPILSELEISKHPPVEAESTPPVPLAYNLIFPRIALKLSLLDNFGKLTIAPHLSPVPKFDGQVRTYPKCSLCIKPLPSALNVFSTSLQAVINLATTSLISFPSGVGFSLDPYMETILK